MSDVISCRTCRDYYSENRDVLLAACASVGIEVKINTGSLLRDYLTGYHDSGHDEFYAKREVSS